MALFWQRESDVHLNTNVLEVDSETMWSGLGGGCSPLGGGLVLLVTWVSCISPLIIYQRQ